MKIALAQLNFHTGNINYNTQKIIDTINLYKAKKVDLIVFSELSVCGYSPGDLLTYQGFVSECLNAINKIATHTQGIAAIVGSPSFSSSLNGKPLANSAFFLEDGKIKNRIHKTLLPTYDVFDEYRYFEPNRHFEIIEFKNRKIALTICEDLWDVLPDYIYNVSPMSELYKKNPDFAINIAASPFSNKHHSTRKFILKQNAEQYKIPFLYVNQTGAQTDLIFDGGSMALDAEGKIVSRLSFFKEEIKTIDILVSEDDATSFQIKNIDDNLFILPESEALILDALVLGVKDYFTKTGLKKCVLGLSGGVDSALVTFIATQALGAENVLPVLLPSKYSSNHSITDSIELCKNLKLTPLQLNIQDIVNTINDSLKPVFEGLPVNLTEENIQSRTRGVLLMALSNKLGNVLLNTSNKSEIAVGYGTLYGDMCGALSVIGDLYKTQVYQLCQWINKNYHSPIPENILTKAPSAELRPDQKDSDSLPDYNVLDKILYLHIEECKTALQIIETGFDKELVNKILKMVHQSEHKRYQAPPVLRVSSKSFGSGRRMPLDGSYSAIITNA